MSHSPPPTRWTPRDDPTLRRDHLHAVPERSAAGGQVLPQLRAAARIAAQALGGEILVSADTRAMTERAGALRFGATRAAELKGLSGTHALHPVLWEVNAGG